MKDKQYKLFLEETILDLFDEIKDLSKDYGFSIDGGDCNFNYILSEYQKEYRKYYNLTKVSHSIEKEKKWTSTI